jgi:hypothetical protein
MSASPGSSEAREAESLDSLLWACVPYLLANYSAIEADLGSRSRRTLWIASFDAMRMSISVCEIALASIPFVRAIEAMVREAGYGSTSNPSSSSAMLGGSSMVCLLYFLG